ncbi:homocysteine-responsive endoplasmic reticulum-resident ubiquitin-like domain member 2 protein isoform X2 [Chrysemys picta bellii]|uniref:homocysteine-responsive endoplasmic reticulum-resident ubiquitin-like domain member 2 protein isoform X2 n=1 Tax=Chrysemys picta bellii TaxID=8478 RepID=UPI0032B1741E
MDQSLVGHPVTLIIKAPNQKYTDQTISCFLDWTVGTLKTHLSKVYPSKPSTKDQRLVYSGRLLPDHLQLKDILRKQDEYHMVHLVCTSRTPPSSPKPSTSSVCHGASTSGNSSNSEHSGSTTPSPTSQESLSTSINSSSDGVRHRNLPQAQSNPVQSHQFPYLMQGNIGTQFPGQGVSTGFSMYPAFSPLQMIWWQQMYARQYYMQYQAAVSAQATSSTEPVRSAVAQPVNSEHVPANEPPAVPNVAAQENRPVNQNVQMNAQGGPVVNEEDFNRDWLDWMYTFSRAAILLSIVYFYSSFSRFVMVMGAMLLVYLSVLWMMGLMKTVEKMQVKMAVQSSILDSWLQLGPSSPPSSHRSSLKDLHRLAIRLKRNCARQHKKLYIEEGAESRGHFKYSAISKDLY